MKRMLERIREILRNRHNRRAWTRIISVIACLVVFFSTYALIVPAITMEKIAYCGIEAHQHDDSCYSEELICTIPESEGHTHDDSCYTTHDELSCQLEEHVHGEGCYDEEGNLICELIEHEHDSSCWQEVTELTCGLEESEGHHHTDACYEKVLTCGKETHTHSEACYELNGPEAAGTAATDARGVVIGGDNSGKPADDKTAEVDVSTVGETDPNAATDSAAVGLTTGAAADPDTYVPTLGELDFNRILNRNTGIYYYHVETAEDAAENQGDAENIGEEDKNQGNDQAGEQAKSHPEEINSADIPADAWQKVNKKTVLGENDILRVYFSYTIPAGSLNETNDIARYRLPANLHISDDQIGAINKTENGIASAFIDYDTLAITDTDAYSKYLGVEAVEGTRRPGEIPAEDAQEYISAVVRVENVYDTEGLYGEKNALLGQDLVFTFVPYTIQMNQNTYDAQGDPTSAGETVKGWFTMDLTIDQIDFQSISDDSSSDSSDSPSDIREAEIVFVEECKDPAQGIDIDEISTKLVLEDASEEDLQKQDDSAEDADDPENADNSDQAENADDADNSEPVGEADVSDVSDKEASAEGDAEKDTETETDLDETNYPAHSFQDSITVRMGSLSTDTNAVNTSEDSGNTTAAAAAPDIQDRTELTVSVEAEEGTFPEGTTMHLASVTGSDLDTVAEAVEGAVESRTAGFHAVDITFRDADGNEIEPRKPIRVSMQSESIRQAVENPSTAPVVVHVGDNKKEHEKDNITENGNDNKDEGEADRKDEMTAEAESSSGIGLDSSTVTGTTVPGAAEADNLTFEADSFSVYAIVYTVDFHYEINGKTYEFSIPGGGFISLEHLVEVLGIGIGDKKAENRDAEDETANDNSSNHAEDTDDTESWEEIFGAHNEAIKLNEVEVSEATKNFVADVESVEFSSPELVWVGKVNETATVGDLKENNGLEVEYSADLTEEQITEINAQTVEAGDWALISVLPFTSEETLTVTMKNEDQWTVMVTDAQKPYKDVDYLENGNYIIYRSDSSNSRYMFLKNDGTTMIRRPENGEALNASDFPSYTWSVTKNWDGTYTIKSTAGNRYINLYGNNSERDKWSNSTYSKVSLSGNNGIAISHNGKVLKRDDYGFFNATGTGVGLTFYKIENDPSGSTSHDTGIELTDEERAELSKWEETIEKFNTLTDYNKTAEVSDYDQRIYKIDIEADSGIMDFYKDVDLGFVLDVSNSMKFPSSLKALEDQQGNEFKLWMDATSLNAAYWAYREYYNRQGCFYILSDPALTSTIYRVFWNGSKWQYQDASSNDPSKILDINDGTTFKEPFRQSYTLYYADDQTQRIDYLNDSVAQAVATLKKIVQPTEGTDDETANVRIAYNFFAGTKTGTDNAGNTIITQYAIRGSNDFVDLRSQESRSFEVVPKGNEADGTRQDLALYDSNNDPNLGANEFGWDTDANVDRYVILVTDGAPNGASMADVEAAARRLKTEDKVKLITIGLSTKDVDGGSTLLKTIADDVDGDGTKDFYEAEKASDLKHILSRILQSIMAKGLVRGKVTDTIDKGFYPVDAQGNPLSAGVYKNGARIPNAQISSYVSNGKPTNAHANEAFYTWEQVGDEWKITWYNQEIGWNDNDASTGNPWTGTVYVKAKEDYLGGNLIETNDGHAQIEPTGIKLVINGTPETNWRPLENMPKIDLPIPRVNVHELETDENSTTFTIYKGTSVTPGEQIKALWDKIPIEEVVNPSEGGQHKITSGAAANVGTAEEGETFSLGSLMAEFNPAFNIDSLINQISAARSSASTSFEYEAYDHKSGTITVTVERTKGNKTPALHTTDTVGNQVEQYEVTFTYRPYTETQRHTAISAGWTQEEREDYNDNGYHNGPNGRGDPTGTMTSTNTHTINVFQKGIQVTKVDKTNTNQVLPGAVFELFRADANGSVDGFSKGLPEGNYTKVGNDLTTDANGIITINPVIPDEDTSAANKTLYLPNIAAGAAENTSHDTVFYLVEKTPPTRNGVTYARMPGAIKFTMTLTENKGNDSTATLYDWTQTAAIAAEEYRNGTTVYLEADTVHTTTGTYSDVYAYALKNGKATDITLIKVDKISHNSIGGAKFSLMRGSENVDLAELTITKISDGAAVIPEEYLYNNTNITVITVPEGGVRIAGLIDDTYTLREVSAPAGYIITDSGKTFKTENGAIKNSDNTAHQNEAVNIAFEVENEPGAELPSTGGPGTTLIYLLGILLTGLAGAGLTMRMEKRRRAA